jgi:hypothetical protein
MFARIRVKIHSAAVGKDFPELIVPIEAWRASYRAGVGVEVRVRVEIRVRLTLH